MKKIIKILLIAILIIFSLIIYLDFSFKGKYILMEGNVEVAYSIIDNSLDNQEIISKINNLSEKNKLNAYYNEQGKDANYYLSENTLTYDYLSSGYENANYNSKDSKKTIYYPDFFYKIKIHGLSEAETLNLQTGYLILDGDENEVRGFIEDLGKIANINSVSNIEMQKSEILLDFSPIIIILILFLVILLFMDSLKSSKKYSILYLEGYSKFEIIKDLLKGYLKFIFIISMIFLILTSIFSIVTLNYSFLKYWLIYFLITEIIIFTLIAIFNYIFISKFDKKNLKVNLSKKISNTIIVIFKLVVTVILISFVLNITLFTAKLQSQYEQLNDLKVFDEYYGFSTYDDGSFSEDAVNYNKEYLNLYLETYNDFDGLITQTINCNSYNVYNGDTCSLIISPYYLKILGFKDKIVDGKVNVIINEGIDYNINEISSTIGISKDEINLIKYKNHNIDIIVEDEEFRTIDYQYMVVLNEYAVNNLSRIKENGIFLIQNYHFKLKDEEESYNEFYSYITKNNLSEQVRDILKISSEKNDTVNLLINKIKINIILFSLSSAIFFMLIILNSFIILKMQSKKKSILILEGYKFLEIETDYILILLLVYSLSFVFIGRIDIYIILMIIMLFLTDYLISEILYMKLIKNKVIKNIKGEL